MCLTVIICLLTNANKSFCRHVGLDDDGTDDMHITWTAKTSTAH